ncbi:MAG: glycoside hydrolase family 15 protein [Archangium sp.]|nr:glycoside hydrolase family 15 protein [Archangium sp.]MDP3572911.1 glycoside hydrolase family 15 protein [Archangium sp.]
MTLADLGLIGNCQLNALVRRDGAIVWACMPRFDSEPIFGAILDEADGGRFSIGPALPTQGTQRYLPNTNVLETRFVTIDGAFRVLDFAPRFVQYDRSFRPTKLLRIVEPLSGTPRVRVLCDPILGWSKKRPRREFGSHHLSFKGYDSEVRLTTDAPLSYLNDEPFALTERKHFVFSWGEPVEQPLEALCERFLRETVRYWHNWVKNCEIPPAYQEEVIRSALALKLHCFEDTGAIVAAVTTSIPEAPGTGRNWDYRYCWLRDAFYTLGAFRLLGHFEEREQFIHYLLNVASSAPDLALAPLYRIDGKADLHEKILPDWPGFLNEGPVRVGNGAALHTQNDVFGEMVLALTPMFLDARFREQVTAPVLDLVTRLTRRAIAVAGQPDAGIWEIRSEWRPQTFSAMMCWAAADRMTRIAQQHRPIDAPEFAAAATRIRDELLSQAVDAKRGNLVADYGGTEVDAALLQAVTLRLLTPEDPRMHATVAAVRADLEHNGWLRRYRTDDGLGVPSVAFSLCTFWLIEAMARLGHPEEARALLDKVRDVKSPLGLLSEDLDPVTGVMWGNFPQAYSHVGLIHAAFAAAPRWSEFGT